MTPLTTATPTPQHSASLPLLTSCCTLQQLTTINALQSEDRWPRESCYKELKELEMVILLR